MQEIPPTPPSALESPGGAGRPRADSIASTPSIPPTAREAERKNIINEILVTERKYVGDLEIMQVISFAFEPALLTSRAPIPYSRARIPFPWSVQCPA